MNLREAGTLFGVDWGQWAALIGVFTALSAVVTALVLGWLRLRLGRYFVTKPDHLILVAQLATEHRENTVRIEGVERKVSTVETHLDDLATKHSMKNVLQRQDSIAAEIGKVQIGVAGLSATVAGMADASKANTHMTELMLNHMLQKDKA